MPGLVLILVCLRGALGGDSTELTSVGVFLSRDSLELCGVNGVTMEVLWTTRLESVLPAKDPTLQWPQVFVTKAGEVFLSLQQGLQRVEVNVSELTDSECFEVSQELYITGEKQEQWMWIDPISGQLHSEIGINPECQYLPIQRLDRTVRLLSVLSPTELSRASWTEVIAHACIQQGSRPVLPHLDDTEFLGYWQISQESLLPDIETVFLFVCISLIIGFRLGVRAHNKSVLHVEIQRAPLSTYSEPCTATTAPCSSPEGSQQSLNLDGDDANVKHLTIKTKRLWSKKFEMETPTSLHSSSEALISDLLSNGRFRETFQDVEMLMQSQQRSEFRAKHGLDQKSYLITVLQFHYEPDQRIGRTAMFREVAAMIKVRYKHIVNYVTCWVEECDEGFACLYIQSQWVDGKSMKAWLATRKTPDRRQNCLIFRQIVKAVAHIHSKQVVHRGIK